MIQILLTLIAGGAMGALITAFITHRRNKRQPVIYTKEMIDIFRKGENFPRLAELLVTEHPLGFGERRSVDNLSLSRITVTNKGNQDLKEFEFGVTLEKENKTVDVRFSGADRHHEITMGLPGVSIERAAHEPVTDIDFQLRPFNRGDTYKIDIYFTFDTQPGTINLSSKYSTEFVERSVEKREPTNVRELLTVLWSNPLFLLVVITPLLFFVGQTTFLTWQRNMLDRQGFVREEELRSLRERLEALASPTRSPTPIATPKKSS